MAAGPAPYVTGIWQPSLKAAVALASKHYLGDSVIQFAAEERGQAGCWLMLRVTGDVDAQLREMGKRMTPRWSFLT